MKRIVLMVVAVAVAFVWVSGASAEMKEGLWEITTKTQMKGVAIQIPPTTTKQCLTKQDMVPKPEKQQSGEECKIKDQKVAGDTVTYTVECKTKDGSTLESKGKNTYKGNTFQGSSTTTVKAKGEAPMQMTSDMSGKYVGPCPK
jgi:hypothetical protein